MSSKLSHLFMRISYCVSRMAFTRLKPQFPANTVHKKYVRFIKQGPDRKG